MRKRQSAWRMWALAMGPKAGRNEKEADVVALMRTIVLISYMVTNGFIVAGVIRHWQKPPCPSAVAGFSAVVETSSGAAKETARKNDLRPKVAGQFGDQLRAGQSNRTPLSSTGQILGFSRNAIITNS